MSLNERQVDCLFVSNNSPHIIYQELANKWTAREPNTWALLLAGGLLNKGFGAAILDCDAEELTLEESVTRIKEINPRLVCFVVMGSNPNSGTTCLSGNLELANLLKTTYPQYKIGFFGTQTSALPQEVLSYNCVYYVFPGDGLYALLDLLSTNFDQSNIKGIPGLGWKDSFGLQNLLNGRVVMNLDGDLPDYPIELLPFKHKPLDLYRSHWWHAHFKDENLTPFFSFYTQLGCWAKCRFCHINSINRTNYKEGITAADNAFMRYWSTEKVLSWIDKITQKYNVKTLRFADEMFFFNRKYYEPLLNGIIERGYKINSWAYARIDSAREKFFDLFRDAGIMFLAYGLEAANLNVRREIDKGNFEDVDMRDIVNKTREHGINVISNFMVGLPNDDHNTMQETLDLALELNTEFFNIYTAMALPGSPLYYEAKQNGWDLPQKYSEWSFHSYDCKPLRTKYLRADEVLRFRDNAWQTLANNPKWHDLVRTKFGETALSNVKEMASVKLKRKILE